MKENFSALFLVCLAAQSLFLHYQLSTFHRKIWPQNLNFYWVYWVFSSFTYWALTETQYTEFTFTEFTEFVKFLLLLTELQKNSVPITKPGTTQNVNERMRVMTEDHCWVTWKRWLKSVRSEWWSLLSTTDRKINWHRTQLSKLSWDQRRND